MDLMIATAIVACVLAVSRTEWTRFLFVIWLIHSVTGAALSVPVLFFGRKRVHWSLVDLLAFVLPFAAWATLFYNDSDGKSLANLIEPVYFSAAIPVAALIRVVLGDRASERAASIGLVALLCVTAIGVYWWMPALPE